MKSALVALLFAISAFAQNQPGVFVSACGSQSVNFDVKLDASQHRLAQPEPGKAQVYFVQDLGEEKCGGTCLTTKIGIDGAWIGAIADNSYFSVFVDPGEHHVCAKAQSRHPSKRQAFAHFTAEVGKVYYFRTREDGGIGQFLFDLDPLDSDQAKYLITSYPLSISHPKK